MTAGTGVARRDENAVTNGPSKPPVSLAGPIADLDSAYRYASALANSDLMPKDLRGKPSNVLAIILYGQQLSLTPMQAIQSIYVVNGRPQMSGQLWLSKVRAAGHRVVVSDHTTKSCTVTITRGDTGEEHSETYTWEDAETAKLAGKETYRQHPKRMLLWRTVSNCATIICPEVALGFGLEGDETEPQRPSLAQVAAQRTDQPPTPEPPSGDDAIEAEIAAIQAQHTAPTSVTELSYDEAMQAETLAFEAEQAAAAVESGDR